LVASSQLKAITLVGENQRTPLTACGHNKNSTFVTFLTRSIILPVG
jgi:hypothetical protein